jgi:CDP-glucose 4,6-dehydratase
MEVVGVDPARWQGRRVLVTGHTGFKGAWLTAWLHAMGARVSGFALEPPTTPSLFELAGVAQGLEHHVTGDVRDAEALASALREASPEIVFHLAAQSLVRESYRDPVGTYATNVMGTVHLLDAVRRTPGVRVVVVATSDKCYANPEPARFLREEDPLGGRDPYSSSKGCAELVAAAWRDSFLAGPGAPSLATVRAGIVIGGGDWGAERLVADAMRAFTAGEPLRLRNPRSTRPWQHVLDALSGYLLLAQSVLDHPIFERAWNLGPEGEEHDAGWVARELAARWGEGASVLSPAAGDANGGVAGDAGAAEPHEAPALRLDSSRARFLLTWNPRLSLPEALDWVVEWHRAVANGSDARTVTLAQLDRYMHAAPRPVPA